MKEIDIILRVGVNVPAADHDRACEHLVTHLPGLITDLVTPFFTLRECRLGDGRPKAAEPRQTYDPNIAPIEVIAADLKHAIGMGWAAKAQRLADDLAQRAKEREDSVSSSGWSSARSRFILLAERWRDAKTSESASVIADIAPAAIARAFQE